LGDLLSVESDRLNPGVGFETEVKAPLIGHAVRRGSGADTRPEPGKERHGKLGAGDVHPTSDFDLVSSLNGGPKIRSKRTYPTRGPDVLVGELEVLAEVRDPA
jgi:hypothetical protein